MKNVANVKSEVIAITIVQIIEENKSSLEIEKSRCNGEN
jgi:hypothetical protein